MGLVSFWDMDIIVRNRMWEYLVVNRSYFAIIPKAQMVI